MAVQPDVEKKGFLQSAASAADDVFTRITAGISAGAGNGLGISISATQTISGDDEINTDDEFWTMAAISYEM